MVRSFADYQRLALIRHAQTGETYCLVSRASNCGIRILPEADVVAGSRPLIDAMLWSTDTVDEDGLDPALLA